MMVPPPGNTPPRAPAAPHSDLAGAALTRELLSDRVYQEADEEQLEVVASAGQDGAVVVWDIRTGRCCTRSEGVFVGRQGALSVSIHPRGRHFVAGGDGKCASRLVSREGIAVPKPRDVGGGDELPLAVQPTDLIQEGHAVVFALPSGKRLRFLGKKHVGSIRSLEVTHDCAHVVTGGSDGVIFVHDFATGNFVRELHGHTDDITSLTVLKKVQGVCISSSWDFTIRIWDWRTGGVIANLNTSTCGIRTIAAASDLGYIVSGGEETARETTSYLDLRDVSYDQHEASQRGWTMHLSYALGSRGRLQSVAIGRECKCIEASERKAESPPKDVKEQKETQCDYVLRVWTA
mmetsp:Transcript_16303/g.62025  ORF Transcript_16303/g.62025 Transcript_16303/m.62025 type:complete len:348 (-) Transcript_16303:41-1084(-)